MLGGWQWGHVWGARSVDIRGWTMLPLTLISIKPFLWNSIPNRPWLTPYTLILHHQVQFVQSELSRRQKDSACWEAVCVWLLARFLLDRLLENLVVYLWQRSCLSFRKHHLGCFSLIGLKMFFQCNVIVCQPSRVSPQWIIPALIRKKSIHGT